jgi:hypothetical protein
VRSSNEKSRNYFDSKGSVKGSRGIAFNVKKKSSNAFGDNKHSGWRMPGEPLKDQLTLASLLPTMTIENEACRIRGALSL